MSPRKIEKNSMEWNTRPAGVGHPPRDSVNNHPNANWVTL